jgi:hypothetical protein
VLPAFDDPALLDFGQCDHTFFEPLLEVADKICGIFCRAFTVAMATSGILCACLWPGIDVSCAVAMFILPPTGKTNVIGNWEKLS